MDKSQHESWEALAVLTLVIMAIATALPWSMPSLGVLAIDLVFAAGF